MLLQQFLMVAMGASILLTSPAHKPRDINDDIAEELQEQIDYLRAAIKKLQEQLKEEGNTNEELQKIQNQFDQLQYELQECYKKIDQLKQELQQEFRQKLNELQSEMLQMYKQLSDRITALEDKVQKLILDQTVGLIKDGNPNTAAQTFKNAEYQKLHLPRVIKDAFGSNTDTCFTILEFCSLLQPDIMNAYGLLHTFEQLSLHIFTSQGSDCAFRLGWMQQKLKRSTSSSKAKESLEVLEAQFPKALQLFVSGSSIRIRQNSNGCSFPSEIDKLSYYASFSTTGCDLSIWKAEYVDSSKGESYRLVEQNSGVPMSYWCILEDCIVFLGSVSSGKDHWKPTLVSNEQLQLQNSVSQSFLFAAGLADHRCFAYVLIKSRKTPFYIIKA